jgi:hypothetical protein
MEEYVNEQNWQRFRKLFLVLALVGIGVIIVGIILLISALSTNVPQMGESGWFGAESSKNGLMFGGVACMMFGSFLTIVGFSTYFRRHITGAMAQGMMPVAAETINKGATNISPATQSVVQSINDAKQQGGAGDIEALLAKAKSLKDRNLITEQEYQEMRKTILGIK